MLHPHCLIHDPKRLVHHDESVANNPIYMLAVPRSLPRSNSCLASCLDRFRTPSTCFEPRLNVIAVSGDRPDQLAPGEPSLWRILRERVEASVMGSVSPPGTGGGGGGERESVDLLLHAGGQSWMADAFEDAWELLKRRAMEPVLGADGGWREAQEEAAERLREVTGILCES